MNINFDLIIQKLLPYFYIFLVAYLLNSLLFFYLPKIGVNYEDISFSNLEYKKYSGFYTNVEIIEEKEQNKNDNIESLSKYNLKAIYSTSSNGGWITIEKAEKSYILSLGEDIDGYVLKKLFKNYVIFEKLSKEYRVDLKEKEGVSYEIMNTRTDVKKEIVIKDNSVEIGREYLNSYIKDVDKIWNNIGINEIKVGEQIDGFEISKINKESVFEKIGLKEGDVIKAINNNQLKSYADVFEIYNNIDNTNYLNIEILRNNEKMELNYEID